MFEFELLGAVQGGWQERGGGWYGGGWRRGKKGRSVDRGGREEVSKNFYTY